MSNTATFTVIDVREAASGTGKTGKPWTLYVVRGDDGKEYTTFDPKGLNPGMRVSLFYEEVAKNGRTQRRIVDSAAPAKEKSSVSPPNPPEARATLPEVLLRLASIEAKVDQLIDYYNDPSVDKSVPF